MGGNGVERKTLIQAFILGLGQVTGKILSLVFLYRFSKDLGNTGLSLYTYAYIPFSIFSDLSTFGLIPGTSKAVSKLIAENDNVYMIKDKKDRLDCCQALKKAERAKKLKLDPAVMASPFITTIVDAISLITYFKIASLFLGL